MSYNPEELEEQYEQSQEIDLTNVAGTIENVETKHISEAYETTDEMGFPISSVDPESDKECLVLTISFEVGDLEETTEEIIPIPESELGFAHPEAKIKKFREKYNDFPQEGQEVQLTQNPDGFLEMVL